MTASTDELAVKADIAKDEASQVARSTKDGASAVTDTAAAQVGHVVTDARAHAQDLVGQATDQITVQADEQTQRLAGNLKELADQIASMAGTGEPGSTAHTLVDDAANRLGTVAEYLDGRASRQIIGDVTDFARRRPGAFIIGSAFAGLLVGRLGRAAKDAPDAGAPGHVVSKPNAGGVTPTVAPMTAPDRSPMQFEEPAAVPPAELPEFRR